MSNRVIADTFFTAWHSGATEFAISSSGSTGQPKTFYLQRRHLEWSARNTHKHLNLQPDESIVCCLPADKTGGFMMLVRAAVLGYPIVVTEPDADPLKHIPENHGHTFISLVPLQLQSILADTNSTAKLNRFRHLLLGGSALAADLEQALQKLNVHAWHTYGMTETYSHIALRKLNGKDAGKGFFPLTDIEISLDERSCLAIKAPFTEGGWLQTNDIAEILPDGSFIISGRADFIINSGGIKLQPERIEALLREYLPELRERYFAVTSVPDERLGEKAILVIEGVKPVISTQKWLSLNTLMPSYHVPKDVISIPSIPLTSTSKPDRIKLKELVSLRFHL